MNKQRTPFEDNLDPAGQYFAQQLTRVTGDLPHDISERLRVARKLALVQRKPLVMTRLNTNAQALQDGSLTAPSDEGLNLWRFLGSVMPLLALVCGLMLLQWNYQEDRTNEVAAIDAALLTDELPPNAYTDAGFAQFLKLGLGSASKLD
jgi:hypothetical protein